MPFQATNPKYVSPNLRRLTDEQITKMMNDIVTIFRATGSLSEALSKYELNTRDLHELMEKNPFFSVQIEELKKRRKRFMEFYVEDVLDRLFERCMTKAERMINDKRVSHAVKQKLIQNIFALKTQLERSREMDKKIRELEAQLKNLEQIEKLISDEETATEMYEVEDE